MDLLAKYFSSHVYQAPDAAAASADPLAPAPAPPADAPSGDAPPVDLQPDTPPAPPPRAMIPQDVFVREVTPLRAKVRETETALEQANRRLAEQDEMLRRLQQPRPPDQPPTPPRDDRGRFASEPPPPSNFEEAVRQESFKREFARDTGEVRTAGMAKFTDFQQTLGVLDALGVTTNQVILDLLSADKANAHVILDHLAKNPEKAAAITSMDQGRRIAEFVRMAPLTTAQQTDKPAAPAAPPARVSRAPNPPPPVDPGATKTIDWRSDEADDATFDAGFHEMMKKRGGARR